jgi:dephospho-CoA kinase
MAPSDKRTYADVVIDNRGSLEETRAQVASLYRKLMD